MGQMVQPLEPQSSRSFFWLTLGNVDFTLTGSVSRASNQARADVAISQKDTVLKMRVMHSLSVSATPWSGQTYEVSTKHVSNNIPALHNHRDRFVRRKTVQ